MNRRLVASTVLAMSASVVACTSLEPTLPKVDASLPTSWSLQPKMADAAAVAGMEQTAVDIGWRDLFKAEELQSVVSIALQNNRDLRVALFNVDRARAMYRVQRASRFLAVQGDMTMMRESRGASSGPGTSDTYSAALGIPAFELDLFGRLRSLSQASLQRVLAQEEARRSAQLSLIAEVANAYLTLAADLESQRIAQSTLETQKTAYGLMVRRHGLGAASGLELSQSQVTIETARIDAARFKGQVAADVNALSLLIGAPLDPSLLPSGLGAFVTALSDLPPQIPSETLLRRPDVLQSEHIQPMPILGLLALHFSHQFRSQGT